MLDLRTGDIALCESSNVATNRCRAPLLRVGAEEIIQRVLFNDAFASGHLSINILSLYRKSLVSGKVLYEEP